MIHCKELTKDLKKCSERKTKEIYNGKKKKNTKLRNRGLYHFHNCWQTGMPVKEPRRAQDEGSSPMDLQPPWPASTHPRAHTDTHTHKERHPPPATQANRLSLCTTLCPCLTLVRQSSEPIIAQVWRAAQVRGKCARVWMCEWICGSLWIKCVSECVFPGGHRLKNK